jgi:hypothetical protein
MNLPPWHYRVMPDCNMAGLNTLLAIKIEATLAGAWRK